MTTCDWHDQPLVCGECGAEQSQHAAPDTFAGRLAHPFQPVHRREDPEGLELTQVVPCTALT